MPVRTMPTPRNAGTNGAVGFAFSFLSASKHNPRTISTPRIEKALKNKYGISDLAISLSPPEKLALNEDCVTEPMTVTDIKPTPTKRPARSGCLPRVIVATICAKMPSVGIAIMKICGAVNAQPIHAFTPCVAPNVARS